jgi:hypothetical protein
MMPTTKEQGTRIMQQRSEELYDQWHNGSTGSTLDTLINEPPEVVADFVAIIFQKEVKYKHLMIIRELLNRCAKMRHELAAQVHDLRQTAQDADEVLNDLRRGLLPSLARSIASKTSPVLSRTHGDVELACPLCGRKPSEPRPILVEDEIACDHCRNWITPHPIDPWHCPNCGSDELDDSSRIATFNPDESAKGEQPTQRIGRRAGCWAISCAACGWHWHDVYEVKGYIRVEDDPRPPATVEEYRAWLKTDEANTDAIIKMAKEWGWTGDPPSTAVDFCVEYLEPLILHEQTN